MRDRFDSSADYSYLRAFRCCSFGAPCLVNCNAHLRPADVECVEDEGDCVDRGPAFTAFNHADVGTVQAGCCSDGFLRQTAVLSVASQNRADFGGIEAGSWHPASITRETVPRLPTIVDNAGEIG